jgi:hypothetical protein
MDNLTVVPGAEPDPETLYQMQEFYCRHCDDDEGGYFRVRLHMGWTRNIILHCPKCGNEHYRGVKDGLIYERHFDVEERERDHIYVPLSAWSKEPQTLAMRQAHEVMMAMEEPYPSKVKQLRDAAPIASTRDIIEEAWLDRYFERHEEAV